LNLAPPGHLTESIEALRPRAYHSVMSPHRIACAAAALSLGACAPAAPPLAAPAPSAVPSPAPAPPAAPPAPPAAAPAASASPTATADAKPAPPPPPPLPPVELVEVPATPLSGPPPALSIAAPAKNQVIPAQKVAAFEIKLSSKGWKLGEGGNHLCVVLDRTPCRRVDDLGRPLRLGDIAAFIDEGQHVLTVLARRGSGEFVRPAGKSAPVASHSFFVGKKVPPVHKDGSPMLFFSPPEGGPAPPEGVLIDFYVTNAEVAAGKYVVHASVGGPGIEQGIGIAIHAPQPMRLRNARPGEYIARLSLFRFGSELGESKSFTTVTSTAQPVGGLFSEVTRSFQVTAKTGN
jgi:hypothetical protein